MDRRDGWLLAGLLAVGLLRGLFFVATVEVWTPVDEGAHFDYVESLATGRGIPVTGQDLVSDEVLEVVKDNPLDGARFEPLPPENEDERWTLAREQIEGFQGPAYYLAMVPFYWLGRPFGYVGAILGVRLGSLVLALVGVALTYVLGRALYPDRRVVAVGAAGALVAMQSFNANLTQATNDAIMPAVGALALLATVRFAHRPDSRRGVVLGLAVALCLLAKGSGVAVLPGIAIALVAVIAARRSSWRALVRPLATAAVAGSVVLAPWLWFNLRHYGELSGIEANADLTVPIIGRSTADLATVRAITTALTDFSWLLQRALPDQREYGRLWAFACVVAVVGGAVVAVIRRRWESAAKLAWLGITPVLGVGALMVSLFWLADGGGEVIGRHLAVLWPAMMLGLAAGVTEIVGRRLATPVLLGLAVTALVLERPIITAFLSTYDRAIVAGSSIVVDASENVALQPRQDIGVDATCRVSDVSVYIGASVAPSAVVGSSPTSIASEPGAPVLTRYHLEQPQQGPLTLTFAEPTPVGLQPDGSPVQRVYCAGGDAKEASWRALFDPQHPPLGRAFARAVPTFWIVVASVGLVASLVALLPRRRRTP